MIICYNCSKNFSQKEGSSRWIDKAFHWCCWNCYFEIDNNRLTEIMNEEVAK